MTGYDEFPGSAQQRAIWFVETLAPGTARYHVPAVVHLTGVLDAGALRAGLAEVVRRHEALRTGFAVVDGELRQRIYPNAEVPVRLLDADSPQQAQALAVAIAQEPFDLHGTSLLRAALIRIGPDRHHLVLVAHHLVCDAWSSGILLRDLALSCAGDLPAPPAIQYADYAVWQAETLTPQRKRDHIDHFRARLTPLPEPLALPIGRPRPQRRSDTGASMSGHFPAPTTAPFAALLTAVAIALHRLTGQEDVVLGAVAAERDRPELAEVVGCLVNTVPVRVDLSGDPDLATATARVKAALHDALAHAELPFDLLVDALRPPRDASRLPLCDVLATWTPPPISGFTIAGAAATVHRLPTTTAKADLTVEAAGEALHVEYDPAVLDTATAGWLTRTLATVAAADPDTPLSRLRLVEETQATALLDAGRAPVRPAPRTTVPHRFAEIASSHADRLAVDAPDGRRSYAELAADANLCASALVAAGVRPGDRVGVRTGRGVAWPVAMLGAMAAGAAVVPVDPMYAAQRTQDMLDDAGATVVVEGIMRAPLRDMPDVAPDDIAYIVYTSGSTGRPKGVAIEHASYVRLAEATIERFGIGPGDRILQFASPSFDAAMWDLVIALLSGATLCLTEPASTVPGPILRDTLRAQRISYVLVPPSALVLVPDDQPLPDLRILVSGGEACPAPLVRRWAAGRRFVNAYGPTEATVAATWWEAPPSWEGDQVPLGDPLPGVHVYLLDLAGQPVPDGIPGEIFVGGANLARGYFGRDDLTAHSFRPGNDGERLYRTGDRAVCVPGTGLVFLGRTDDQVKIRGFRVEPAEAQRVLQARPGVQAAAVVARTTSRGTELVGYYAVTPGAHVHIDELWHGLRAELPAYLIPAHLVELASLPLTPNGKLDRAALPAPVSAARSRAPRPGLETEIAGIWCEVLGLGAVGAEDNFFDAGGHSLALAAVHAKLVRLAGRDIALVELFTHPTVAAMAEHLGGGADAASQAGRDRAQARRDAADRMRRRPA